MTTLTAPILTPAAASAKVLALAVSGAKKLDLEAAIAEWKLALVLAK